VKGADSKPALEAEVGDGADAAPESEEEEGAVGDEGVGSSNARLKAGVGSTPVRSDTLVLDGVGDEGGSVAEGEDMDGTEGEAAEGADGAGAETSAAEGEAAAAGVAVAAGATPGAVDIARQDQPQHKNRNAVQTEASKKLKTSIPLRTV
jgi:hypothetical protein